MSEQIARQFHGAYERLAPQFGYETREDTKVFDPQSQNGRLMIAVCAEVIGKLERERDEVRKALQSVMDWNPKAGYWERPETVGRFEADMARAREVLEETRPTQTTNQPQISTKLAL